MVLSSTYSLPPTRYSRDVLEKLADIADQLTKVVDAFCAISKDLNTITTTTSNRVTTIIKTDIINTIIINESNDPTSNTKTDISETTTKVVTEIHVSPLSDFPANPTRKTPKLRHDIAIFHQTTIHATYGVATLIDDNLTIFRRQETFQHGHQCPPPKFIFLQTEPEPPWKLFTLDYGNLGLEDKAVFQDGSIDTSPVIAVGILS